MNYFKPLYFVVLVLSVSSLSAAAVKDNIVKISYGNNINSIIETHNTRRNLECQSTINQDVRMLIVDETLQRELRINMPASRAPSAEMANQFKAFVSNQGAISFDNFKQVTFPEKLNFIITGDLTINGQKTLGGFALGHEESTSPYLWCENENWWLGVSDSANPQIHDSGLAVTLGDGAKKYCMYAKYIDLFKIKEGSCDQYEKKFRSPSYIRKKLNLKIKNNIPIDIIEEKKSIHDENMRMREKREKWAARLDDRHAEEQARRRARAEAEEQARRRNKVQEPEIAEAAKVFGIKDIASLKERDIDKIFRSLALKYHPDKNRENIQETTVLMQKIIRYKGLLLESAQSVKRK